MREEREEFNPHAGVSRARLNSPAREGLAYVCNFN
jgi:hypothetical protein